MSKSSKIKNIILETVNDGGSAFWCDIVRAVREANIEINNWMTVRNVLQGLINSNKIKRTDSIRTEEYIKI